VGKLTDLVVVRVLVAWDSALLEELIIPRRLKILVFMSRKLWTLEQHQMMAD
jgi:hypothetical protein